MQDFTKPIKLESSTALVATKSIEPKIDLAAVPTLPPEAKKGFIEARKNKDNFWNLMFALGLFIGSQTIGLITALVILPFILKRFNGVKFIEGKFLNSEGNELIIPKQLPNSFLVIATTIAPILIMGAIFDSYFKHLESVGIIIGLMFICFIPVLFFIFKNCPISILFNYQFYKQNARVSKHSGSNNRSSLYNDASSHQWKTDPMKSYRWDNTYHR